MTRAGVSFARRAREKARSETQWGCAVRTIKWVHQRIARYRRACSRCCRCRRVVFAISGVSSCEFFDDLVGAEVDCVGRSYTVMSTVALFWVCSQALPGCPYRLRPRHCSFLAITSSCLLTVISWRGHWRCLCRWCRPSLLLAFVSAQEYISTVLVGIPRGSRGELTFIKSTGYMTVCSWTVSARFYSSRPRCLRRITVAYSNAGECASHHVVAQAISFR